MVNILNKIKLFVYLCSFVCILCCNIQTVHSLENDIKNWFLSYGTNENQPNTPDNGEYSKYDVISIDKSGNKDVYFTFDAGYENGNIEKTLNILKEHNIKGAFFVLPNLIKRNPELLKRMDKEGHLICNHTKSHRNMARVTDINEFKKELSENEETLKKETGLIMKKYYRPPEGAYSLLNLSHAKELGYKTVFWSLAHADWDNNNQPDPHAALEKLCSRIHPGCVILLHPTSETNTLILDKFIVTLKEKGYSFKTLDEFPMTI